MKREIYILVIRRLSSARVSFLNNHLPRAATPLPGDDVPPDEGQASDRLEQHEELKERPRMMKKEKESEKALKEEAPDQLLRTIAEYVSLTSHYDIYLTRP